MIRDAAPNCADRHSDGPRNSLTALRVYLADISLAITWVLLPAKDHSLFKWRCSKTGLWRRTATHEYRSAKADSVNAAAMLRNFFKKHSWVWYMAVGMAIGCALGRFVIPVIHEQIRPWTEEWDDPHFASGAEREALVELLRNAYADPRGPGEEYYSRVAEVLLNSNSISRWYWSRLARELSHSDACDHLAFLVRQSQIGPEWRRELSMTLAVEMSNRRAVSESR